MSEASAPAQPRLAWLDALRGIGALAVVAEHMTPWFLPSVRPQWFHLGVYGIFVFFLVSGYIIPASLERHGDVRTFWLSRVFRLYPLFLAVGLLVVALHWWVPVREAVERDWASVADHATMLLDVVDVAGVADTMWTLSYEMVFYLMVTALFMVRLHHRSGLLAMLFAAGAVATGVLMTRGVLTGGWVAYVSCAVFVTGLVCLITGRFRRTAAAVLGVMALTLLVLGSRVPWVGGGGAGADVRRHRDLPLGAGRGPVVAGGGHARGGRLRAVLGDHGRVVVGPARHLDHHDRARGRHVRGGHGAARAAGAPGARLAGARQLLALPGAPPAAEVLHLGVRRPPGGAAALPARHDGAGADDGGAGERVHVPLRGAAHAGAGPADRAVEVVHRSSAGGQQRMPQQRPPHDRVLRHQERQVADRVRGHVGHLHPLRRGPGGSRAHGELQPGQRDGGQPRRGVGAHRVGEHDLAARQVAPARGVDDGERVAGGDPADAARGLVGALAGLRTRLGAPVSPRTVGVRP
ncbi:acyltransferase family protein [Nonomuraea ferruginea]